MFSLGRALSRAGGRVSNRHIKRRETPLKYVSKYCSTTTQRPTSVSTSVDAVNFNIRIQAFRKQSEYSKAIDEYQRMLKANVKPDAITFNLMIQIMARIGRPDKAQAFFDLMGKYSIEANTIHYNALITAYTMDGNMGEAENILRDMRQKKIARDQATYTIMIKGYAQMGRLSDAEHHFGMFMDHVRQGVNRDQAEKSVKRKAFALDEVLAGVMIDVYLVQQKTAEARDLFMKVLALGLTTKADAVNTFISAMLTRPEPAIREETLNLVSQMEQQGSFRADSITYNIMMNYWLGELEKQLKRTEPKPDPTTLEPYTQYKHLQKTVLAKGIPLQNNIFGTMIRFATVLHDRDELDFVLGEHKNRRGVKTLFLFNTILEFWTQYPERGDVDVVEKINATITQIGLSRLKPSTVTYNIVISFYSWHKNVDAVSKLFSEMVAAKVQPDSSTYAAVLSSFASRPDSIMSVLQDMEESGVEFTKEIFKFILEHQRLIPSRMLARFLLSMLEKGIKPDVSYHTMCDVCEFVLRGYVYFANYRLGQDLWPTPLKLNLGEEPAPENVETEVVPKKTKGKKKKSKKQVAKEDEDDELDDDRELPESEMVSEHDLERLEDEFQKERNFKPKKATPEEIRKELIETQARVLGLYVRLRTAGISMRPAFLRDFFSLFRNELPTCLAVGQDILQQTKRTRAHLVTAECLLAIIQEETVMFHDEIHEWNAKLLACKPPTPESKLAPVMDEELRKEFATFLTRVSASLRPAESTSHKTLLSQLQA